ncbi:lysylphosphatidylglycerol synthase domain-containing protein [Halocalculus aciditolerans]|uniref:Uncharacterized protein n=1 Tax=Halocalculus aciditolerans TaxID=1383812 RepID=A0A830F5Z9_9EURY|nr:lysylphosphatidylglycerol synthase domain-containing protein [Halocalculus aciditolerans]GGL66430.1 hypothetical protein GCM10009039_25490 [Halocalculus aciditolerans]
MRRELRFAAGVALGAGALAVSLFAVGPGAVLDRVTAIALPAAAVVFAVVLVEATVDGLGVWASVRPLNRGLTPGQSVQFAFAGDFFDTLSPAGPVSSEPIMARFFGVATDTSYSDALGVRGVAKYVKSAAQVALSLVLVAVFLLTGPAPRVVVATFAGAAVVLVVAAAALLAARASIAAAATALLAPVVRRVSALYRDDPHDRDTVAAAVDRFWTRVLAFRDTPRLLGLVALGGVLEQLLTATALWVALAGTGTPAALLPIVAIVPLPQAASVVPIPASLGAYDVLLAGAVVLMTGVPADAAAAAVLVVRTFGLLTAVGGGGLATAFLRGWRPGA